MTDIDVGALSGIDLLRAMQARDEPPASIGRLLGMRTGEIEEGRVSFSVTTRADFANPMGTTHGGICATLLDSVMGCAVHTTLEAGASYATLELKVNYVRPVSVDGVVLTATGTVIHTGRRTATAEGRILDDQGRLVAHGTTTCLVDR